VGSLEVPPIATMFCEVSYEVINEVFMGKLVMVTTVHSFITRRETE
jgi:hypothetical protein